MSQFFFKHFQILQLVPINFFSLDLSITNFLLINLLALLSFLSFIYYNASHNNYLQETSLFFISNSWQKSIESISEITAQLISDIISSDNEKYFSIISVLFNFILFSNLIGLVPYSFTATSHLIITFTLSFSVFIGINIITFEKYKMKTFSLFLPANTTFFLALLLVPIEFISYIAKPISLGVRLFINLMAGHSLLKVIIGFSWSMLLLESFTSMGLILPMIILVILFNLKLKKETATKVTPHLGLFHGGKLLKRKNYLQALPRFGKLRPHQTSLKLPNRTMSGEPYDPSEIKDGFVICSFREYPEKDSMGEGPIKTGNVWVDKIYEDLFASFERGTWRSEGKAQLNENIRNMCVAQGDPIPSECTPESLRESEELLGPVLTESQKKYVYGNYSKEEAFLTKKQLKKYKKILNLLDIELAKKKQEKKEIYKLRSRIRYYVKKMPRDYDVNPQAKQIEKHNTLIWKLDIELAREKRDGKLINRLRANIRYYTKLFKTQY